jgi:hypothetical protein
MKYFELWNNRDLNGLASIFHNDIFIKDWESQSRGIEEALAKNAKIFFDFPLIKAELINTAIDGNTAFLQLDIQIDNTQSINVVDIITAEKNQITGILAYRQ